MAQKIPTWVWLAGIAGAGYALYKLSDAFKRGVNYVTAPVTDAIANALIATDPYLSQPTVQSTLTGSVLFSNGAQVPVKNLNVYASGADALVSYQGLTWKLSPHDANGNYQAVPV